MHQGQVPLCTKARFKIVRPMLPEVDQHPIIEIPEISRKPTRFIRVETVPCGLSSVQILSKPIGIARPIANGEGLSRQQWMIPPISVVVRQRVNDALDGDGRRHTMDDADLLLPLIGGA